MQLVAIGAQDAYLTGEPVITFFRSVWRMHTNFAIEAIEQVFNGTAAFGRKISTTIARNADLASNMWLQIKVPEVTASNGENYKWVDSFGHALLKVVEFEVGGTIIDKHYADWYEIRKELFTPESKVSGFDRMVNMEGKAPGDYVYVPLQFYFNTSPGLALPLIALQFHETKINIEFERLEKLLLNDDDGQGDFTKTGLKAGASVEPLEVSLFVDYVYLGSEERTKFAQTAHEYLIEAVQHTGPETWNIKNPKIKLNFSHPVKALYWVMHDEDELEPLKFTDSLHSLKIQLNGQDRFAPRPGSYFHLVEPYVRQTRVPDKAVYMYSFALHPEQHQPSGTCNFSRIDTAHMFFDTDPAKKGEIKIFATHYNLLKIQSGMAGLSFAS